MKLDPIFTIKNNILYKIDDNSQVATSTLKQIEIKWSTVEISDEAYNEEYLAQLREDLKAMEEAGTFAVLVPVVDKPLDILTLLLCTNDAGFRFTFFFFKQIEGL